MSTVQGPRPVKVILGEALAELRAREQRLVGALTEVRAALNAFEQAAEPERVHVAAEETHGAPVTLVRQPSAVPVTDKERDELVCRVIADTPGCAMRVLLAKTGMTVSIVKPALQRLRESGELQIVGKLSATRYWLTADLDRYVAEHNGHLPNASAA